MIGILICVGILVCVVPAGCFAFCFNILEGKYFQCSTELG